MSPRRILRGGIPYGLRGTTAPKGLLFPCSQRVIGRPFECFQRAWMDNPNFPEFLLSPGPDTGDGALIGQRPRPSGSLVPRRMTALSTCLLPYCSVP